MKDSEYGLIITGAKDYSLKFGKTADFARKSIVTLKMTVEVCLIKNMTN